MKIKSRTLTLILTFSLVLFVLVGHNVESTFSMENHGGRLDIFTQKEPFSGRGLNMSSDAFGPEEKVVVYASVTYNDYPVEKAQVAFEIHGPQNSVQNITFLDSVFTNSSGVANISFRIGLQSDIFLGQWKIFGSVYLVDEVLQDFLSFQAGWILEITSIKTVDRNNVEQTKFTKGSLMGVELSVRNIAMTEKKATIAVTIYDSLSVSVNSTQIDDCKLPANGTITNINCFLVIPQWASTGNATASACAYTAPVSLGGVPYCPKVSTYFSIVYRDVGILEVEASPAVVYKGGLVNIDVTVKNEGCEIESFELSVYYNNTHFIGAKYVANLQIDANVIELFVWNTSALIEGFYEISAYAEPVPDEIDTSDNLYVDGVVEVKPPPLTYLLNITSSPISDVNFTINGAHARTPYSAIHMEGVYAIAFPSEWTDADTGRLYIFSRWEDNSTNRTRIIELVSDVMLTAYYEEAVLTYTLSITSDPILGVDFIIDGVMQTTPYSALLEEKSYTIVMPSSVTDSETGKVYNFRGWEDGSTNLTRTVLLGRDTNLTAYYEVAIRGWFVTDWFYWLLPALLVLIIVLLIIWFYRRRRKKAEDAFYSGWTAWYYCYDLRSKIPKI